MSLTREQWLEMWDKLKRVEKDVKFAVEMPLIKRQRVLNNLEHVKIQVQSVIGQME